MEFEKDNKNKIVDELNDLDNSTNKHKRFYGDEKYVDYVDNADDLKSSEKVVYETNSEFGNNRASIKIDRNGVKEDDRMLSMILWGGAIFFPIVLPIIIYLLKQDSNFVKRHVKSYANMTISYFIYYTIFTVVVGLLGIITLGLGWGLYAVYPLLTIPPIVITILAIADAYKGEIKNYPTCIEFFKVK